MSDAGRAPNTTDFNPNFAPRLQAFRDALTKAGIQTTVASGYRSPEYQNQMYQNHLAKAAGKTLPYPNVEAPSVVAPAWQSFHNYGLAADVTPANPADYKRMWDMAPQFGLTALRQKDIDHFQMSGSLGSNISQYKLAGWRPDSSPAPASGAIAYNGPSGGVQVASAGNTPIGTTINASTTPIAGGLAKPAGGGGFMSSVANIESNDRNIPSAVDKDYPGQPGSKSQGHWQIDTPTWLQFGAAAGIDTTKYPNAMSAPRDIQEQVARTIPLSRFGGRTVRMLNEQYGALDKSQTLGALDAKYGGGAPGAPAANSSTGDTPPAAVAPAAAPAAPADEGTWWQKAYGAIVDKPKDAQGNPTGKPSPMENIASAFEKGPARMKALEEDQAPESARNYTGTPPPARNVSPGLANVSQTYGQTLNSFSQPLTWNDAPPQAPQMPAGGFRPAQAGQGLGVSLNSVQPSPYGVGYGIPSVGYGYG